MYWSKRSVGQIIYDVCYGKGKYVGFFSYYVKTSEDGFTWEQTRITGISEILQMVYGNGIFVMRTKDSNDVIKTLKSENGIEWSECITNIGDYDISYCNNQFMFCDGTNLNISKNMIDFEPKPTDKIFNKVIYGKGFYLAISGTQLYSSYDLETWEIVEVGENVKDICYGRGTFCLLGATNIMTSEDGFVWVSKSSYSGTYSLKKIEYKYGVLVAIGGSSTGGRFVTSENLTRFTVTTYGKSPINEFICAANRKILVGITSEQVAGTIYTRSILYTTIPTTGSSKVYPAQDNEYKQCEVYIGQDNEYKQCEVYVAQDGEWKLCG